MKKKRKVIIIVVSVLLVVGVSVLVYFLSRKEETTSLETPIIQETLYSYDESEIDMSSLPNEEYKNYKVWEISPYVNLKAVEKMVSEIDPEMVLTAQEEGILYHWDNSKGNTITYSLFQNKVEFDFKEGILWGEQDLNNHSFSRFVKKYFDREWNYGEVSKKSLGEDVNIYYANRLTEDNIRIEMPSSFTETDSLVMEGEKIVSGDILLVDFIDSEIYVPLIDTKELSKYINVSEYPKSINVNLYDLVPVFSDTITGSNLYLNTVLKEIMDEDKNCRALKNQVVYYYSNFDHKFLTPIFKLDLECQYEYMDQLYYFVGTGYASAIDPYYISVPE